MMWWLCVFLCSPCLCAPPVVPPDAAFAAETDGMKQYQCYIYDHTMRHVQRPDIDSYRKDRCPPTFLCAAVFIESENSKRSIGLCQNQTGCMKYAKGKDNCATYATLDQKLVHDFLNLSSDKIVSNAPIEGYKTGEFCCCQEDACNSSSHQKHFIALIMLAVHLAMILA